MIPERYVSHTGGTYLKAGAWMLWRRFVESVKESWLEAGEITYGERCEHVIDPHYYNEFNYFTDRCRICGRLADRDEIEMYGIRLAQWWTPADWDKPKESYVERVMVNGRYADLYRRRVMRGFV